jgi:hypothetical protein
MKPSTETLIESTNMASDHRTGATDDDRLDVDGGRLEDRPDQVLGEPVEGEQAAFGPARRMDVCCGCSLRMTNKDRHWDPLHIGALARRAPAPCGSELGHRRCRVEAGAAARPRSAEALAKDEHWSFVGAIRGLVRRSVLQRERSSGCRRPGRAARLPAVRWEEVP